MNDKEILKREDELSNWRLVSLLAFNALLIPSLNKEKSGLWLGYDFLIPLIGCLITFSFLFAMYVGLIKKHELHVAWKYKNRTPSPIAKESTKTWFFIKMSLEPFMACPLILFYFWLIVGYLHLSA